MTCPRASQFAQQSAGTAEKGSQSHHWSTQALEVWEWQHLVRQGASDLTQGPFSGGWLLLQMIRERLGVVCVCVCVCGERNEQALGAGGLL